MSPDRHARTMLPIPDRPSLGLTTYDAKDPDTWYPPIGPFDAWPSVGGGFETFYGFIGGENNQWDPALYDVVPSTSSTRKNGSASPCRGSSETPVAASSGKTIPGG